MAGDVLIDGGNSYYQDDLRRAAELQPKGVHYVDVGTSGGIWGAVRGYCLMIGGESEIVQQLEPLFAALATDTGWFRFRSLAADSFRFAAQLVDAGAVPQEIYTALYERDTLARIQLIGRIIARAQTEMDGRLVHTACFREDFEATGAEPSDTEDVVTMTLAVAGTQVR